jgi:hypothetical protein
MQFAGAVIQEAHPISAAMSRWTPMSATINEGTILFPIVFAGFVFGLYKVRRKTKRGETLKQEVMQVPTIYRHSHQMKYMLNGHWSLKTLGGMVLIVTRNGVGMTIGIRGLSDVLGTQWWARSSEFRVRIERIVRLPLSEGADWIVIQSSVEGNNFQVAILPDGNLHEILNALQEAGAHFDN